MGLMYLQAQECQGLQGSHEKQGERHGADFFLRDSRRNQT